MKPPKYFFNLESRPNKSDKRLIYFNLNYGYKVYNPTTNKNKYKGLRLSTGYAINRKYWIQLKSTESQDGEAIYKANQEYVRKHGKDLNDDLIIIRKTSIEQLRLFVNQHNQKPEPAALKQIVLEKLGIIQKEEVSYLITDFIESQIEKRTNLPVSSSDRWSINTGNQYNNLRNHFLNFEERIGRTLTFKDLNEELYLYFFESINEAHVESTGFKIKHNTIAKNCKHLRTILNKADTKDISIGFNHKDKSHKIREVITKNNTSLTPQQLLEIFNKDVSHSKEFTNARNYILISSSTGLRYEDMYHLKGCEIKEYKSKNKKFKGFFTIIRKSPENKEELNVIIPITEIILKVLRDNNNTFPSFPTNPVINRQIKKFLKFLKYEDEVIFKEWYWGDSNPTSEPHQLKEKFKPHDCRYTFITNLSDLDVPEQRVKKITHPSIKAKSIVAGYDLASLEDNAYKLIRSLKGKKTKFFKY